MQRLTISSLHAMTMPGQTQEGIEKCDQQATFSKHVFTVAIVVLIAADKLIDLGVSQQHSRRVKEFTLQNLFKSNFLTLAIILQQLTKAFKKVFSIYYTIPCYTPLSYLFLSFKSPFKNFSKGLTKNCFSRTNEIAS